MKERKMYINIFIAFKIVKQICFFLAFSIISLRFKEIIRLVKYSLQYKRWTCWLRRQGRMRLTARIIPVTPTHFPCAPVSRLLQKFIPEKCRKRWAVRVTYVKCGTLYSSEGTFSPSCSRKLRWYNWRLRGRDTRRIDSGARWAFLNIHLLIIPSLATSWFLLINNRRRKDIIRDCSSQ